MSLPKGPSDHFMMLTLDLDHDINATLINCYAPTLDRTEQEKDDFYKNLHTVISHVQHRVTRILMGDFNARLGNEH